MHRIELGFFRYRGILLINAEIGIFFGAFFRTHIANEVIDFESKVKNNEWQKKVD